MAIGGEISGPAHKVIDITPSDSVNLEGMRGVYIGATGDVAVRCIHSPDTTVTFVSVPAGTILPLLLTRVMAATTATNIVGLY